MENKLVEINYNKNGNSKKTNSMGMREMQARAFEKRNSQHLLIKSPPASGKSRALMFIALDKLLKQGVKKVIVAVPERSIGASFKDTNLTDYGFYADWKVNKKYNLTLEGSQKSKVKAFVEFMNSNEEIIIATHSTFRHAYEKLDDKLFDNVLVAIDEFHHVSSEDSSVLGTALKNIIRNTSAHIVAMTGSYFRGDSISILEEIDEDKFDKVTYSYYEQLDGYEYLKSFSINYSFYKGSYLDSLYEVLDTNKKTIIHIPNVNSRESTKDKHEEVEKIFDIIGEYEDYDEENSIHLIRTTDGRLLKVADLVEDNPLFRSKISKYLANISDVDDMDIIIALGMAKEGFDWPYCEHALTIGYRSSLTEIVQIIGRCTRDSSNKNHAQFTNLIASPDAENDEINSTVNTFLKAISASLLMESVLKPDVHFRPRKGDDEKGTSGTGVFISGLKAPSTQKVKDIVEKDLADLRATILSDNDIQKAMTQTDVKVVNDILIPKVIQTKYPKLTNDEIKEVADHVIVDMGLKSGTFVQAKDGSEFLKFGNKLIKVDELSIDLIRQVCPFQEAYKVMSKNLDVPTLKIIQREIDKNKYNFTTEELLVIYPLIKRFVSENQRKPLKDSVDEYERRLAFALVKLNELRNKRGTE